MNLGKYGSRRERIDSGPASDNPHDKNKVSISELKINLGPGYRVYYYLKGNYASPTIVLLGGGDKSYQQPDIDKSLVRLRAPDSSFVKDNEFDPRPEDYKDEGDDEEEETKKGYEDYGAKYMPKPMFEGLSDEELLAAGVEEDQIKDVRSLLQGDEDGLMALVMDLSLQAGSFLLEKAVGDKAAAVSGSIRIQCKLIELKAKAMLV